MNGTKSGMINMKNNKKKKYIFFLGWMCEGGAERVVAEITNQLAERECRTEVLTYFDEGSLYKLNDKVKLVPAVQRTGSKNIIKNIIWVRAYCRKNADVVISFLAPFNMFMIVSMFGTKVPVIAADRNDPRKIPEKMIVRKLRDLLYCLSDAVVAQTQNNKAYFPEFVRQKCHVIYNPVHLGDRKGAALYTEKKKQVVSAGRLIEQKNYQMLLEAFAVFYRNHSDYSLILYGEGRLKSDLQESAKQLGIHNHVVFYGSVNDLFSKIACAELFVMTSCFEGMSNALAEAMCLGLPVISTKVSGALELIQDGVNGFLVDIGDVKKLADLMGYVIDNKKEAEKVAKNAVQLNEMLQAEQITDQWLNLIHKVRR